MNLIEKDLKHIWHPCSQMKDYETFPPLIIKKAKGCYLELENGQKIIDATSSWWCKNLGHQHPRLQQALKQQLKKFEQVILANTVQEPLVQLSEKLCHLRPGLNKIFYASEGASAVEIALKMSIHAQQLKGETGRRQILSLKNAYHGETCLSLAVSDLGLYKKPYEKLFPKYEIIESIPYVCHSSDPLFSNCDAHWDLTLKCLAKHTKNLAAIIVESLIQGAGGMLLYSMDFLRKLQQWAKQNNVYFICDEIMTGFGRLGETLASKIANIAPDFICLGKGLTGGMLPMSAVLTTDEIYELFYDDYEKNTSFLHSHTFSGNALAASVALACVNTLEEDKIYNHVHNHTEYMLDCLKEVARKSQRLQNVRGLGFVVAADLILDKTEMQKRMGFQFYQEACRLGAMLRPLGNTVYWMPPLIAGKKVMHELRDITLQALKECFKE